MAALVGKNRVTVSRWLSEYRKGGLEQLLTLGKSSGRPRVISLEIEEKLKVELEDKEGFLSYGEVQKWLKVFYNKDVNYSVVHKCVRYRLDNGRLHTAKSLEIPDNIVLVFQPPYCPQINPIERLWKEIKKKLKWDIFRDLNKLRDALKDILNNLSQQDIIDVTFWEFLKETLFVANI